MCRRERLSLLDPDLHITRGTGSETQFDRVISRLGECQCRQSQSSIGLDVGGPSNTVLPSANGAVGVVRLRRYAVRQDHRLYAGAVRSGRQSFPVLLQTEVMGYKAFA